VVRIGIVYYPVAASLPGSRLAGTDPLKAVVVHNVLVHSSKRRNRIQFDRATADVDVVEFRVAVLEYGPTVLALYVIRAAMCPGCHQLRTIPGQLRIRGTSELERAAVKVELSPSIAAPVGRAERAADQCPALDVVLSDDMLRGHGVG